MSDIEAHNPMPPELAAQGTLGADQRVGAILRSYLEDVWIARNANAIPKYFDEDVRFLAEARARLRIDLEGLAEDDPPVQIKSITSNASTAIAFCTLHWGDGNEYDMFMLIEINSKGLISYYRWMSQLPVEISFSGLE